MNPRTVLSGGVLAFCLALPACDDGGSSSDNGPSFQGRWTAPADADDGPDESCDNIEHQLVIGPSETGVLQFAQNWYIHPDCDLITVCEWNAEFVQTEVDGEYDLLLSGDDDIDCRDPSGSCIRFADDAMRCEVTHTWRFEFDDFTEDNTDTIVLDLVLQ